MLHANNNNISDAREDILKRLEQLNKLHDEQKKILLERQTMQRKILGLDKKEMYKSVGLQKVDDSTTESVGNGNSVGKYKFSEHQLEAVEQDTSLVSVESLGERLGKANLADTLKYVTDNTPSAKCSRSFLKRGEGLKKRFKIDPDKLRLHNLPRYKYAGVHIKDGKNTDSIPQKASKAPKKLPSPNSSSILDVPEKLFQKRLISSENVFNSTPETRSPYFAPLPLSPKQRKVHFNELAEQKNPEQCPDSQSIQLISWAKVLDSQMIKPIPMEQLRMKSTEQQEDGPFEDEHLSIFELLEQKANDGTIDMESSCIKRFMERKVNDEELSNDETDEIPVDKQLQEAGLKPTVNEVLSDESFTSSEDYCEENDTSGAVDTGTTDGTDTGDETEMPPSEAIQTQPHVRFSSTNETHEYEEEEGNPSEASTVAADGTSMCGNSVWIQQFKDVIAAALQNKIEEDQRTDNSAASSSTVIPKNSSDEDLLAKTNLIKSRLVELEKEIATFKENNIRIIKAKQEHELEKAMFEQERLEAMDRLKDEKIQMEIDLHDERMKIEEEKRKFEQQMRVQRNAQLSKDRKEISRLKQEVDELQLVLKQKEQVHIAAQTRLRVQIRNLERDQKHLNADIERLEKENKKLQNENAKLVRENSDKMLRDINTKLSKATSKSSATDLKDTKSVKSSLEQSKPRRADCTTCKSPKSPPIKAIVKKSPPNKNANKPATSVVRSVTSRKVKPSARNRKLSSSESSNEANEDTQQSKQVPTQTEACCGRDHDDIDSVEDDDDDIDDILKESNILVPKNSHDPTYSTTSTECNNNNNENTSSASTMQDNNVILNKGNSKEFKREIINEDGSRDIWYPNGSIKKISADGMTVRMLYFNKDIKETNINEGTVRYYYAKTNTWHTTYLDGLEIYEFPNGQTEHRYKNGVVEVHFPDNVVKVTDPADELKLEEWRFANGTTVVHMHNGDKILTLPNGQREIHTKFNKRREYPDGTVKVLYPDGSQETRYSTGRVRLKDKDGKLILDTDNRVKPEA